MQAVTVRQTTPMVVVAVVLEAQVKLVHQAVMVALEEHLVFQEPALLTQKAVMVQILEVTKLPTVAVEKVRVTVVVLPLSQVLLALLL
jgi:hypothetical protein